MKWDTDAAGLIIVNPLVGFYVAPMEEIAVLVRIEFARTPDQLGKAPEALQLGLTPATALQFAEDLRKTAEQVLALPRPMKPN